MGHRISLESYQGPWNFMHVGNNACSLASYAFSLLSIRDAPYTLEYVYIYR